jgi:phosphoenolpyruvate---glycerone phosphotransferase subunit DhaL
MDNRDFKHMIAHVASVLETHEQELTRLDQAIGDGDHGINMKRGAVAVASALDEITALPFGEAMKKIGMTLVMSVGGASGPLYGTLAMSMGKASAKMPLTAQDLASVLEQGLAGMKAHEKSDVGAKTMIDVLAPVQAALARNGDVRKVAKDALADTAPMLATKGQAAFLGERSIRHIDPGARSSFLIVDAICDVLEGKA